MKKISGKWNGIQEGVDLWGVNDLAHMVLGGLEPQVLAGNFIGDVVKGRQWETLPERVGQGVLVHRQIDSKADTHPASLASRALLRPIFGRMSGVALDMLHDHLLAREFEKWVHHEGGLSGFADEALGILEGQTHHIPPRRQRFLEALRRYDWLTGYAEPVVMREVCAAMDARIPWPTELVRLMDEWGRWESDLVCLFEEMFTDLMQDFTAQPPPCLPLRTWQR